MRHGRIGSQWRHIKQTNTYSGSNLMFIDGTVRVDDSIKYPIPNFGYPPLKRPQHKFSGSYNDLSTSNPATRSLDTMTWSMNDTFNHRPSGSQHSNRFQRQAKDNFPYWPSDSKQKKTHSKYKNPEEYPIISIPIATNYSNDENEVRNNRTNFFLQNFYSIDSPILHLKD